MENNKEYVVRTLYCLPGTCFARTPSANPPLVHGVHTQLCARPRLRSFNTRYWYGVVQRVCSTNFGI